VTNDIDREPPGDQQPYGIGRNERGVDEEKRDHHADDRSAGRLAARLHR
jgi:hypothetical protein